MTFRKLRVALAVIVLAGVHPAAAQIENDPDEDRDRDGQKPFFYLPISLRTVENVLERGTEEWSRSFDFDEEQRDTMRDIVKSHMLPFLRQNRASLGRVASDFIEAQTGDSPPDPDHVAAWADRALAVADRFKQTLDETAAEMREHLTYDQALQLDGQVAAMSVGFNMMRNRLVGWAEGGFDPETDWYPEHPDQRPPQPTDVSEPTAIDNDDEKTPATQPAAPDPSDEWTIFVTKFIERYDLNADQRDQAFRMLRKYRTERDEYLNRPRTVREMEELTETIETSENEIEKTAARERIERIEDHVDTIFEKLEGALDTIPTREQRADAARRAIDAKPSEKEAEKEPGVDREKKEDPGSP